MRKQANSQPCRSKRMAVLAAVAMMQSSLLWQHWAVCGACAGGNAVILVQALAGLSLCSHPHADRGRVVCMDGGVVMLVPAVCLCIEGMQILAQVTGLSPCGGSAAVFGLYGEAVALAWSLPCRQWCSPLCISNCTIIFAAAVAAWISLCWQ